MVDDFVISLDRRKLENLTDLKPQVLRVGRLLGRSIGSEELKVVDPLVVVVLRV